MLHYASVMSSNVCLFVCFILCSQIVLVFLAKHDSDKLRLSSNSSCLCMQIILVLLFRKTFCQLGHTIIHIAKTHFTDTSSERHENEQRHDKTNKVSVRPARTQINLGIRLVWSESSLPAWRKLGSLATHWVHSEDSDQTGQMPRLIWVFAVRTHILLVLSCRGSNCLFMAFHVFFENIPEFLLNIHHLTTLGLSLKVGSHVRQAKFCLVVIWRFLLGISRFHLTVDSAQSEWNNFDRP